MIKWEGAPGWRTTKKTHAKLQTYDIPDQLTRCLVAGNIKELRCLCSCKFQTFFTLACCSEEHLLSYYHCDANVADVSAHIYMTMNRRL